MSAQFTQTNLPCSFCGMTFTIDGVIGIDANIVRNVILECGCILCLQCATQFSRDIIQNQRGRWVCPNHNQAAEAAEQKYDEAKAASVVLWNPRQQNTPTNFPPVNGGGPPNGGGRRGLNNAVGAPLQYNHDPTVEFVDIGQPGHQLLPGFERRKLALINWKTYLVRKIRVMGYVDDAKDYGEEQHFIGMYREQGYYVVVLPENVVNTMLAWWEHRVGGKTRENFVISTIYLEQLLNHVTMTSSRYLTVKSFVPVVAYLSAGDLEARRALEDMPTLKRFFFTHRKLIAQLGVTFVGVPVVMTGFAWVTTRVFKQNLARLGLNTPVPHFFPLLRNVTIGWTFIVFGTHTYNFLLGIYGVVQDNVRRLNQRRN